MISSKQKQRLLIFLQVAIAIACLVYIIQTVNWRDAKLVLYETSVKWILFAFICLVCASVLQAYRWKSLDYDLDIPLTKYLYYVFIGYVTGFFLPSSYSGDAVKVMLFGKKYGNIGKNVARISVARGIGLLFQFVLASLGIWYYAKEQWSYVTPYFSTMVIVIPLLLLFVSLPFIISYFMPQVRKQSWYKELLLIVSKPRILFVLCLQTFLIQSLILLAGGFVFVALHYHAIFPTKIFLFPVLNLFSALPFVLNGIGVRESIGVWVFSTLGNVEESIAVAAMLECYLLSVFVILLGVFWLGFRKWNIWREMK